MGPEASAADLAYAEMVRAVNTSNKAYYLAKQLARGGYAVTWYVSKDDKTLLNELIKKSKQDKVKMRSDWENVKDQVMRKAVWAKFTQHPKLRQLLIDTKDAHIAENSPRDSYWGLGQDGDGENMLGQILAEVRAFLSGKFPDAPTVTSNWIVPGYILASAYPGAPDPEDHVQVVDALLNAPISLVLSLQEPHEEVGFNSYREIIAPGFKSEHPSFCEKVWSSRYKRPIILMRVPIKDHSDAYLDVLTDTLVRAVGKHYQLLVHCLGDKGRTGTVVAVMLGKMYGMSAEDTFALLAASFKSRVERGKYPGMPQTKVQFDQVRTILDESSAPTSTETITEAPTVVCIKKDILKKKGYADLQDWLNKSINHVYIGRNMTFYVPGAVGSKWKNPFALKKYTLPEALAKYEQHVRDSPELMAALSELGGKVLGCWCKPNDCHGDVLVELYKEMMHD